MKIISLPYTNYVTPIFSNIAKYKWSIWLDSNYQRDSEQRFDIISGFPLLTICTNNNHSIIKKHYYNNKLESMCVNFKRINTKTSNIYEIINNIYIKNYKTNNNNEIPFTSGFMGYFSYDLNTHLYKHQLKTISNSKTSLANIGLYGWALITDHKLHKTYITYDEELVSEQMITNIQEKLCFEDNTNLVNDNTFLKALVEKEFSNKKYISHVNKTNYLKKLKIIENHIYNGDCYQINYTIPFKFKIKNQKINSWHTYQYLKNINKNPFGCYFNVDKNISILSFSPERFIKVSNNIVTTEPIKGTRKHNTENKKINNQNINDLLTSTKDRAENIMITDLMRNDLNKFCTAGSVKTTAICTLKTFPTVHHLVSTITGKLDSNKFTTIDLLKGCSPGGSITGTPKIRAMQIIQQLEQESSDLGRNVYCGNIGYISFSGNVDMSIAIRTFLNVGNEYIYWAGSGVIADSVAEQEYTEVHNKLLKLRE